MIDVCIHAMCGWAINGTLNDVYLLCIESWDLQCGWPGIRVDDGRMSSRCTWVVLGTLLHLLLQGGVGAMSRLSMVGNGVRLLVLLNRGHGADVMYPLSSSLDC